MIRKTSWETGMKNVFAVLVLVGILLLPPGVGAGELQQIQKRGVITVSLNRDYPPFSMEKEGTVFGLDVDLAHLMAEILDVKVIFIRPDTYDQQIPKLLAGESDIIMAAMTRTMERALQVDFSSPYFEVSQAALVRRDKVPTDAGAYFDLLPIEGLRLGVKTGTTHEAFAQALFPTDRIKGYPTANAAADAMVAGDVDAMVADSPFVQVWRNTHVQHYPKITALLEPVTREFYAFAIRKGDPDFLNWLNLFVEQIRTDGTLDLLKYEYFEKMAWAAEKGMPEERLSRPKYLQNRFIADKKAMIEQRRQAYQEKGANYE
jgi:polar amino acid transport system substrate-binding protein